MNKLLLIMGLLCSGTVVQAALAPSIDLPNFREVISHRIYRGGQPTPVGIQTLAKMGIKTVIDLRMESPFASRSEMKLAESLGMKAYYIPISPFGPVNDQTIAYLENTLLSDPNLQPVFIHCHYGEDRTGLVIALHRVFKESPAWTPQQAYTEMLQDGFHETLHLFSNYFFMKTQWRPGVESK